METVFLYTWKLQILYTVMILYTCYVDCVLVYMEDTDTVHSMILYICYVDCVLVYMVDTFTVHSNDTVHMLWRLCTCIHGRYIYCKQ